MKERLDVAMVGRSLVSGRDRAKEMIKNGRVFINGKVAKKAGQEVSFEDEIVITGDAPSFVSRGGLKLEAAMEAFPLSIADAVCMDIGASTGGFTDCMLSHGAAKVYAIDVGSGQLDMRLQRDERVVNMEKTNVRYIEKDAILEEISFFSVDVSFISLTLVLPAILQFLSQDAQGVCLIKPQFEAGRENVGKKGVVKDKKVHASVIDKIITFSREIGLMPKGLTFSPVKGPEGNIEYLLYVKKGAIDNFSPLVAEIVDEAHGSL